MTPAVTVGPTRARRLPRRLAAALLLAAAACASPGIPPGGPTDKEPPALLATKPDSGAIGARPKEVAFIFDEVVNERPSGDSLPGLVLLSPTEGRPRVHWRREAIGVAPRKGWRPNTTYAVTLLPGIADLQGNAYKTAQTIVFSTGGPIATGVVRGDVFDWVAGKAAPRALIEATAPGDTLFRWLARADSTARFVLPYLPPGPYRLRLVLDENRNGALDPREGWDTLTVEVRDSVRTQLYGFTHDTIGPRLLKVEPKDSVPLLRIAFDRPVAPSARPDTAQFVLQAADSTRLRIRRVLPAIEYDSSVARAAKARLDSAAQADTSARARAARAKADSVAKEAQRDSVARAQREALRALRDTTRRREAPKPPPLARPVPVTDWVLELLTPLPPAATFRLQSRDVQGLAGTRRTSDRVFTTPKPKPPADTTKGRAAARPPADTTKGRPTPDTTKARPASDTTTARPAPPPPAAPAKP